MVVPAKSLDRYFGDANLNLIKIDVEGAGTAVAKGMKNILSKTRPILLIKYHGDDEREMLTTLIEANYELRDLLIENPGEAAYYIVTAPL